MADKKKFRTKEDGTKIFDPDFSLKQKIGGSNIEKLISVEKIKAAESVVEKGKESFTYEILKDVDMLKKAFEGFIKNHDKNSQIFREMIDAALNIKSSAGMYGYELATEVAKSLFEFCMEKDCTSNKGLQIINVHIDAIKTIFKKNIKGLGGEIGKELLSELEELTNKYHHAKEDIVAAG